MKTVWTFVILTAALCANAYCADETRKTDLNVFAAASLVESFKELGKQFEEKHPTVNVAFNFGASNALRTQMEHGATADVFASANTKERIWPSRPASSPKALLKSLPEIAWSCSFQRPIAPK